MYTPPKRKPIAKDVRERVFNKYNKHCAYCGCEITQKDMQVDHLIPMEFYESYKAIDEDIDCENNYMPACRSCNHYKSTYTLEKFRAIIERGTDILLRDSVTYKNAVRFKQIIPNKHKVVFYFEELNESKKNGDL